MCRLKSFSRKEIGFEEPDEEKRTKVFASKSKSKGCVEQMLPTRLSLFRCPEDGTALGVWIWLNSLGTCFGRLEVKLSQGSEDEAKKCDLNSR
jgi:hypothetical protein